MARKQSFTLVEVAGNDEIGITDDSGRVIVRVVRSHADVARAFAELPVIAASLHDVLDGAEGYVAEVGDDQRYWRRGVLERAARLIELPHIRRLL